VLREFLTGACTNAEMRGLAEFTLIAGAGACLPDERVPSQEYAAALCTLIQRHSGFPTPEFWHQLATERPRRGLEVAKLKAAFAALAREAAARPTPHGVEPERGWRLKGRSLAAATVLIVTVAIGTYCANAPSPTNGGVECRDGTVSRTCEKSRAGCCSHHGGVRDADDSRPAATDSKPASP